MAILTYTHGDVLRFDANFELTPVDETVCEVGLGGLPGSVSKSRSRSRSVSKSGSKSRSMSRSVSVSKIGPPSRSRSRSRSKSRSKSRSAECVHSIAYAYPSVANPLDSTYWSCGHITGTWDWREDGTDGLANRIAGSGTAVMQARAFHKDRMCYPDHYAAGGVTSFPEGAMYKAFGMLARQQNLTPATLDCYAGYFEQEGGVGRPVNHVVGKYVAGAFTALGTNANIGFTPTYMKVTADGTTITSYVSAGASTNTKSGIDSTFAAGAYCGLIAYISGSGDLEYTMKVDNFDCQEV